MTQDEYLALGRKIKELTRDYNELFGMINGNFPKNSQTMKYALRLNVDLMKLYYQTERDYLKDYPNMEVNEYGKRFK